MAYLITHAEAKAQAKRERKAAKRRRDAERSVAGKRARHVAILWLCALERLARKGREGRM